MESPELRVNRKASNLRDGLSTTSQVLTEDEHLLAGKQRKIGDEKAQLPQSKVLPGGAEWRT